MRIRVTTRANLFEKRKREHIERGYGIEDERQTASERILLVYRREGAAEVPPFAVPVSMLVLG